MSPSTRLALRAAAFAAVLAAALPAAAVQITLGWDASSSPGVAGYRVFYGTSSGYYPSKVDAGNATSVTISGLQPNQAYYFTIASYDAAGNQSSLSNEVSVGSGASAGTGGTGNTGGTGGSPGAAAPSPSAGGGGGCVSDSTGRPDVSLGLAVLAAAAGLAVRRRRAGRSSSE